MLPVKLTALLSLTSLIHPVWLPSFNPKGRSIMGRQPPDSWIHKPSLTTPYLHIPYTTLTRIVLPINPAANSGHFYATSDEGRTTYGSTTDKHHRADKWPTLVGTHNQTCECVCVCVRWRSQSQRPILPKLDNILRASWPILMQTLPHPLPERGQLL